MHPHAHLLLIYCQLVLFEGALLYFSALLKVAQSCLPRTSLSAFNYTAWYGTSNVRNVFNRCS